MQSTKYILYFSFLLYAACQGGGGVSKAHRHSLPKGVHVILEKQLGLVALGHDEGLVAVPAHPLPGQQEGLLALTKHQPGNVDQLVQSLQFASNQQMKSPNRRYTFIMRKLGGQRLGQDLCPGGGGANDLHYVVGWSTHIGPPIVAGHCRRWTLQEPLYYWKI